LPSQGEKAIEAASGETNRYKRNPTYQTDSFAADGKRMQDMDYALERFHHFVIVSSKFSKCLCLLLKDCGDGLDRIAVFELPSERMVDQFLPCLLFIILQGSIKERFKNRARWVTHVAWTKGIWISRGICLMRGNERQKEIG
jgi:hypothetical protein